MTMKLTPPANANYSAVVVRVRDAITLPGLDNLVGVPMMGYQALTQKTVEIGSLKILFTAETQLSEEYCRVNNLHRHSNFNEDPSVTGYLEDNRRVRALKFRGNRSSALLMPLESLAFTGYPVDKLREGDSFDTLNGHEICKKYVVKKQRYDGIGQGRRRFEERIDEKLFPKHLETDNFFRNSDRLKPHEIVYISQKLHGTSIRAGHVPVQRKLKWYEKLAKRFGVAVEEKTYDYIFGSRNVIKDPNNPDQPNFYSQDLWTEEGKKLEGLLPKDFIIYGEIVGWVDSTTPIQKKYTYDVPPGERHLYIYRVTTINSDGVQIDLGWSGVKEFCKSVGLRHVPDFPPIEWLVDASEEDIIALLDQRFAENPIFNIPGWALPLSDPDTVDEGVVIRQDGLRPVVLKAKSPVFLEHETKQLDAGVADLESEESEERTSDGD